MQQSVTRTDLRAIEALIDGELSATAAKNLRARIDAEPDLQARFDALTHQKELLQLWWSKFSKN